MSATVQPLIRVFVLNGHQFLDPNPALTPENALAQLGAANPELNNASIGKSTMTDNVIHYEIKQNFGSKG